MTIPASARVGAVLCALGIAFATTFPASASSVSSLLASAEHNTNTVRTLQHHDVIQETAGSVSINAVVTGQEDEVRNRERDFETVTAKGKLASGKTKTIHYTLEVIFLNGHTYFRTTLAKNKWQKHAGLTLSDPYSGITFHRARTTVTFQPALHFTAVGGSQTHLQAQVAKSGVRSVYQVWLSNGATPYVTRELTKYASSKKGHPTGSTETTFGPFNKPIVILPPTSQGSA